MRTTTSHTLDRLTIFNMPISHQIKMQVFGLLLAATTAIGCIAYEKIVKSSSYFFTGFLASLSYIPFWVASRFVQHPEPNEKLDGKWVVIFLLSGCTGPLWYWITRTKTVLTGAVFEVKYIGILMVASIIIGEKGVTANIIIGAVLAMFSI